ncbi:allantoicase [Flindersiella endophytica]
MTTFEELPDLAVRALGGGVVAANDELFAAKENLVATAAPVFSPSTFGAKGQIYDGWETRRRRTVSAECFDWAIVRLGAPGIIHGVVVDTAFFRGNYPPECALDGCVASGYPSPSELLDAAWVPLVLRSPLRGDARNPFEVDASERFTHVRLRIYPDGGVARLRVHGLPSPDPQLLGAMPFDLAAMANGGRVLDASNRFFSRPGNLIMPGVPQQMSDGWETARRRDDGNDWVLVQLARRGLIRVVELDTSCFIGNAPAFAAVRGLDVPPAPYDAAALNESSRWFDLLPRTRLQPDTPHRFLLADPQPATHLRLDIYPDGGLARLRCFGEAS